MFLNCALLSWCCAGQFCDVVRPPPPPAPALLWITEPGVNRAAATFSGLVPDCHVSQSSCSSYLLFNFFLLFFWIYYVKSSVRLFMSTPVSPISSRLCVCVFVHISLWTFMQTRVFWHHPIQTFQTRFTVLVQWLFPPRQQRTSCLSEMCSCLKLPVTLCPIGSSASCNFEDL